MSSSFVRVDPFRLAADGDDIAAVSEAVIRAWTNVENDLSGTAGMAGDDEGAENWARDYDELGKIMNNAAMGCVTALQSMESMLVGTARAYNNVEGLGAGKGATSSSIVVAEPTPFTANNIPSAIGQGLDNVFGDVAEFLEEKIAEIGLVFPRGDTDKLRTAKADWEAFSRDIDSAKSRLSSAISGAQASDLPHTNSINNSLTAIEGLLGDMSGYALDEADQLEGIITAIDDTRHELQTMITALLLEIAVGAGISIALSFVTFGGAAAVGAGAAAIRIGKFVVDVAVIIRKLASFLRISGQSLARIVSLANKFKNGSFLWRAGFEAGSGVASSVIANFGADIINGNEITPTDAWGYILGGAAGGIVGGPLSVGISRALPNNLGVAIGGGAVEGAASNVATEAVTSAIKGEDFNIIKSAVTGGIGGAAIGGVSHGVETGMSNGGNNAGGGAGGTPTPASVGGGSNTSVNAPTVDIGAGGGGNAGSPSSTAPTPAGGGGGGGTSGGSGSPDVNVNTPTPTSLPPTTPGGTPDGDAPTTTPTPADTTPTPADTTPTPADTTPAPADTTPAPADTTPAPADTTPAPADTTPAPADTTPAPADTTPAPADTTPAPADTTPADTTPAPADTTPTDTTPAETTPEPESTPGENGNEGESPADTTSEPGTDGPTLGETIGDIEIPDTTDFQLAPDATPVDTTPEGGDAGDASGDGDTSVGQDIADITAPEVTNWQTDFTIADSNTHVEVTPNDTSTGTPGENSFYGDGGPSVQPDGPSSPDAADLAPTLESPDGTSTPDAADLASTPETAAPVPHPSASATYPPPHFESTVHLDNPGSRTPFGGRNELEPNTRYEVEGRGTFYTDADGKITYVDTSYGGGDTPLNQDLMRPTPNTTYVVNDHHVFETGPSGETLLVNVDGLTIGDAHRSGSIQSRIGDLGGPGYDGGHLIANSLGGGAEDINMVAMIEKLNRGSGNSFFNFEAELRGLVAGNPPAHRVDITILPVRENGNLVPTGFNVDWSIDGVPQIMKEFFNV